jgi:hypothetical protein
MGIFLYDLYKLNPLSKMKKQYLSILAFVSIFTACNAPKSPTQNADQAELVNQRVNDLRDILINPTSDKIDGLVHEKLTYGHSSGKIEDKAAFKDALLTGDDIVAWDMSEKTIQLVDNTAWVRHAVTAKVLKEADTSSVDLKVLLTWVNINGEWKLLARQAVK